jgi:hypothetical protein
LTTFVPFSQPAAGNFQFNATLNGAQYRCVVTWNVFGQRYYLNVYGLDGTLMVSEGMSGSPTGFQIEAITWNAAAVTVKTSVPHGYKIGSMISLSIDGVAPSAYNGRYEMIVTGPSMLTFPLASNPGPATVFGTLSYDVNLVGAYFAPPTSLVFRQQSQQFEIGP